MPSRRSKKTMAESHENLYVRVAQDKGITFLISSEYAEDTRRERNDWFPQASLFSGGSSAEITTAKPADNACQISRRLTPRHSLSENPHQQQSKRYEEQQKERRREEHDMEQLQAQQTPSLNDTIYYDSSCTSGSATTLLSTLPFVEKSFGSGKQKEAGTAVTDTHQMEESEMERRVITLRETQLDMTGAEPCGWKPLSVEKVPAPTLGDTITTGASVNSTLRGTTTTGTCVNSLAVPLSSVAPQTRREGYDSATTAPPTEETCSTTNTGQDPSSRRNSNSRKTTDLKDSSSISSSAGNVQKDLYITDTRKSSICMEKYKVVSVSSTTSNMVKMSNDRTGSPSIDVPHLHLRKHATAAVGGGGQERTKPLCCSPKKSPFIAPPAGASKFSSSAASASRVVTPSTPTKSRIAGIASSFSTHKMSPAVGGLPRNIEVAPKQVERTSPFASAASAAAVTATATNAASAVGSHRWASTGGTRTTRSCVLRTAAAAARILQQQQKEKANKVQVQQHQQQQKTDRSQFRSKQYACGGGSADLANNICSPVAVNSHRRRAGHSFKEAVITTPASTNTRGAGATTKGQGEEEKVVVAPRMQVFGIASPVTLTQENKEREHCLEARKASKTVVENPKPTSSYVSLGAAAGGVEPTTEKTAAPARAPPAAAAAGDGDRSSDKTTSLACGNAAIASVQSASVTERNPPSDLSAFSPGKNAKEKDASDTLNSGSKSGCRRASPFVALRDRGRVAGAARDVRSNMKPFSPGALRDKHLKAPTAASMRAPSLIGPRDGKPMSGQIMCEGALPLNNKETDRKGGARAALDRQYILSNTAAGQAAKNTAESSLLPFSSCNTIKHALGLTSNAASSPIKKKPSPATSFYSSKKPLSACERHEPTHKSHYLSSPYGGTTGTGSNIPAAAEAKRFVLSNGATAAAQTMKTQTNLTARAIPATAATMCGEAAAEETRCKAAPAPDKQRTAVPSATNKMISSPVRATAAATGAPAAPAKVTAALKAPTTTAAAASVPTPSTARGAAATGTAAATTIPPAFNAAAPATTTVPAATATTAAAPPAAAAPADVRGSIAAIGRTRPAAAPTTTAASVTTRGGTLKEICSGGHFAGERVAGSVAVGTGRNASDSNKSSSNSNRGSSNSNRESSSSSNRGSSTSNSNRESSSNSNRGSNSNSRKTEIGRSALDSNKASSNRSSSRTGVNIRSHLDSTKAGGTSSSNRSLSSNSRTSTVARRSASSFSVTTPIDRATHPPSTSASAAAAVARTLSARHDSRAISAATAAVVRSSSISCTRRAASLLPLSGLKAPQTHIVQALKKQRTDLHDQQQYRLQSRERTPYHRRHQHPQHHLKQHEKQPQQQKQKQQVNQHDKKHQQQHQQEHQQQQLQQEHQQQQHQQEHQQQHQPEHQQQQHQQEHQQQQKDASLLLGLKNGVKGIVSYLFSSSKSGADMSEVSAGATIVEGSLLSQSPPTELHPLSALEAARGVPLLLSDLEAAPTAAQGNSPTTLPAITSASAAAATPAAEGEAVIQDALLLSDLEAAPTAAQGEDTITHLQRGSNNIHGHSLPFLSPVAATDPAVEAADAQQAAAVMGTTAQKKAALATAVVATPTIGESASIGKTQNVLQDPITTAQRIILGAQETTPQEVPIIRSSRQPLSKQSQLQHYHHHNHLQQQEGPQFFQKQTQQQQQEEKEKKEVEAKRLHLHKEVSQQEGYERSVPQQQRSQEKEHEKGPQQQRDEQEKRETTMQQQQQQQQRQRQQQQQQQQQQKDEVRERRLVGCETREDFLHMQQKFQLEKQQQQHPQVPQEFPPRKYCLRDPRQCGVHTLGVTEEESRKQQHLIKNVGHLQQQQLQQQQRKQRQEHQIRHSHQLTYNLQSKRQQQQQQQQQDSSGVIEEDTGASPDPQKKARFVADNKRVYSAACNHDAVATHNNGDITAGSTYRLHDADPHLAAERPAAVPLSHAPPHTQEEKALEEPRQSGEQHQPQQQRQQKQQQHQQQQQEQGQRQQEQQQQRQQQQQQGQRQEQHQEEQQREQRWRQQHQEQEQQEQRQQQQELHQQEQQQRQWRQHIKETESTENKPGSLCFHDPPSRPLHAHQVSLEASGEKGPKETLLRVHDALHAEAHRGKASAPMVSSKSPSEASQHPMPLQHATHMLTTTTAGAAAATSARISSQVQQQEPPLSSSSSSAATAGALKSAQKQQQGVLSSVAGGGVAAEAAPAVVQREQQGPRMFRASEETPMNLEDTIYYDGLDVSNAAWRPSIFTNSAAEELLLRTVAGSHTTCRHILHGGGKSTTPHDGSKEESTIVRSTSSSNNKCTTSSSTSSIIISSSSSSSDNSNNSSTNISSSSNSSNSSRDNSYSSTHNKNRSLEKSDHNSNNGSNTNIISSSSNNNSSSRTTTNSSSSSSSGSSHSNSSSSGVYKPTLGWGPAGSPSLTTCGSEKYLSERYPSKPCLSEQQLHDQKIYTRKSSGNVAQLNRTEEQQQQPHQHHHQHETSRQQRETCAIESNNSSKTNRLLLLNYLQRLLPNAAASVFASSSHRNEKKETPSGSTDRPSYAAATTTATTPLSQKTTTTENILQSSKKDNVLSDVYRERKNMNADITTALAAPHIRDVHDVITAASLNHTDVTAATHRSYASDSNHIATNDGSFSSLLTAAPDKEKKTLSLLTELAAAQVFKQAARAAAAITNNNSTSCAAYTSLPPACPPGAIATTTAPIACASPAAASTSTTASGCTPAAATAACAPAASATAATACASPAAGRSLERHVASDLNLLFDGSFIADVAAAMLPSAHVAASASPLHKQAVASISGAAATAATAAVRKEGRSSSTISATCIHAYPNVAASSRDITSFAFSPRVSNEATTKPLSARFERAATSTTTTNSTMQGVEENDSTTCMRIPDLFNVAPPFAPSLKTTAANTVASPSIVVATDETEMPLRSNRKRCSLECEGSSHISSNMYRGNNNDNNNTNVLTSTSHNMASSSGGPLISSPLPNRSSSKSNNNNSYVHTSTKSHNSPTTTNGSGGDVISASANILHLPPKQLEMFTERQEQQQLEVGVEIEKSSPNEQQQQTLSHAHQHQDAKHQGHRMPHAATHAAAAGTTAADADATAATTAAVPDAAAAASATTQPLLHNLDRKSMCKGRGNKKTCKSTSNNTSEETKYGHSIEDGSFFNRLWSSILARKEATSVAAEHQYVAAENTSEAAERSAADKTVREERKISSVAAVETPTTVATATVLNGAVERAAKARNTTSTDVAAAAATGGRGRGRRGNRKGGEKARTSTNATTNTAHTVGGLHITTTLGAAAIEALTAPLLSPDGFTVADSLSYSHWSGDGGCYYPEEQQQQQRQQHQRQQQQQQQQQHQQQQQQQVTISSSTSQNHHLFSSPLIRQQRAPLLPEQKAPLLPSPHHPQQHQHQQQSTQQEMERVESLNIEKKHQQRPARQKKRQPKKSSQTSPVRNSLPPPLSPIPHGATVTAPVHAPGCSTATTGCSAAATGCSAAATGCSAAAIGCSAAGGSSSGGSAAASTEWGGAPLTAGPCIFDGDTHNTNCGISVSHAENQPLNGTKRLANLASFSSGTTDAPHLLTEGVRFPAKKGGPAESAATSPSVGSSSSITTSTTSRVLLTCDDGGTAGPQQGWPQIEEETHQQQNTTDDISCSQQQQQFQSGTMMCDAQQTFSLLRQTKTSLDTLKQYDTSQKQGSPLRSYSEYIKFMQRCKEHTATTTTTLAEALHAATAAAGPTEAAQATLAGPTEAAVGAPAGVEAAVLADTNSRKRQSVIAAVTEGSEPMISMTREEVVAAADAARGAKRREDVNILTPVGGGGTAMAPAACTLQQQQQQPLSTQLLLEQQICSSDQINNARSPRSLSFFSWRRSPAGERAEAQLILAESQRKKRKH